MPTHVYHPNHSPTRWYDRVLVHPLDNAVALLAALFGLIMLVGLARAGFSPSVSLLRLPLWGAAAVAVFCSVGGTLSLVGLHWFGDSVSKGWGIERMGWLLISGGLAGYGIAVGFSFPGSVYSWLVPALLSLGALLRFVSLILIERNTRKTLLAVREEAGTA